MIYVEIWTMVTR